MTDLTTYIRRHHVWFRAPAEGAPIVVFANSLGTDLRIWDSMLPLLPRHWGLLRYDMRGHGLSALSEASFTIDDLADDLTGLIDALGIGPFIGIGVSVGGLVMQRLAVRNPAMQAAVLMDTAPQIGTTAMWNDRIAAVTSHGIAAISDAVLQRWFGAAFIASDPAFPMWEAMLTRTPPQGYAQVCEAIRDADLTRDLARIDLPVLVLAGAQDQSTPPDLVRRMSDAITGARFVQIEAAGHLPCIEQPHRTAAEIIALVDRTSAG